MSGCVWTWTKTPTDADIVSGFLSGLRPDLTRACHSATACYTAGNWSFLTESQMRYVAIISAAFFLGLVAILVAASNSKCDAWVLYLIGSLIVASSTLSMVAAGVHFGMSAAVELIEHGEVSALSRKINPEEDDDGDL